MSIEKLQFSVPIVNSEGLLYTDVKNVKELCYSAKEYIGYLNPDKVVVIPRGTTTVTDWRDYNTVIENASDVLAILIPPGVKAITLGTKAYGAFANCTSIKSIEIPDGVTSIGFQAFYGCSSLTSIEISDSVTSIGMSAFSGCSSLMSILFNGTKSEWNSLKAKTNENCFTNVPHGCTVTSQKDNITFNLFGS